MPMKSSLVSGGITLGVTDLIPTVDWALGGFHGSVPTSASSLVATLIVAGLHAAYNAFVARAAAKAAQQ
ncbi:TPA: hypothetical protein QDA90_004329 [Burkholderia vietnamiensis]|nr:hypothetical protein [Burkholderia vietnamiensis]HDR9068998.1 hypothetical protein [Burkholderia vietnamiensis]